MSDHPILFSTDMVKAILSGKKTQTRRIVKPQPTLERSPLSSDPGLLFKVPAPKGMAGHDMLGRKNMIERCPHGQPGDLLWVRETFKYWNWTEDGMPWIKYAADDKSLFFDSCIPDEWCEKLENIWVNLSDPENYKIDSTARDRKWRPNIFLPRWASRLTLKTTDIRIERVQDISEEDAKAEGVKLVGAWIRTQDKLYEDYLDRTGVGLLSAKESFQTLWDSINSKSGHSWDKNPWVWVIEFEVINKNIDKVIKETA